MHNRQTYMNACSQLDGEILDRFVLGQVHETAMVENIEEHLLVCEVCQQTVESTIRFIAVLRAVDPCTSPLEQCG
jgi:hypothetical protein